MDWRVLAKDKKKASTNHITRPRLGNCGGQKAAEATEIKRRGRRTGSDWRDEQ